MTTTAQIESQLASARARLATLDADVQRLSLPAVSGDSEAAAALSQVNTAIRQVSADIAVLDRARIEAARQEREAKEADEAAYRARSLAVARDRVADLMRLAGRADEMVAAYKALITEISQTERAVWDAAREAGMSPDGAVIGRKGLASFMTERMFAISNGRELFLLEKRDVAAIVATAWEHLLDSEGSAHG
jgi:hypothetical protein